MKKNSAQSAEALIKAKFARLKKIQTELTKLKALYVEHDQLLTELLPLFITGTPGNFIIAREYTVGAEKHKLSPFFWDEKKNAVLSKVWKSTAFQTAIIE